MAAHAMLGVTNGCGHLLDQPSSVKVWSIKRSTGASKQDQAIKSIFWRSKVLIAVADGSTGYIAVTTPCQVRWVGQLTGETRHSVTSHLLMLIIRLTRPTYLMAQLLFLQRRETMIGRYNLLSKHQSWEAGTLTTTRTPSTQHIKTSPSN